ncbi:MAG: protein phosphatase CheZ [Deltaproteobacteria bacterium]|nr:protein phosphatase CheZ [Deltaproteobacteria bacterium]
MESRENARYLILANVNGKKTAIQVDGLYTILPPQNFPPQIPNEIQYQDERLPLYRAGELVDTFEKKSSGHDSYEQLYREFLSKVKEVSDDVANMKRKLSRNMEQDLARITHEGLPTTSDQLSSIQSESAATADNIMGLTEKVQESQQKMGEKFSAIKSALEEIKKQETSFFELIEGLEGVINANNSDLTKIMTTLTFHDITNQKLQKVVGAQEEMEDKLLSILFHFGIEFRKEENPDDEVIKRGEEMLHLLQGANKKTIDQEEVDQLLTEFLK